ncbi:Hint domain-containing protein [Rhodoblastus sp.]|uniref:Hint domain-containing protein n=1 Tax=Rhodoblastus sp. TaxID=1962975 RepID=UPI003F95B00E
MGTSYIYGTETGVNTTSGNTTIVESGGLFAATTVENGGTEIVLAGGQTGEYGGGTGTSFNSYGTFINGGTLELQSGALLGANIEFNTSSGTYPPQATTGGVLKIDGATNPSLDSSSNPASNYTILNFTPGNTIDLTGVAYDTAGTVTLLTGNELQIVENGVTYDLQLGSGSNFTGEYFHLSADTITGTGSGTAIIVNTTPPCYCGGTLISTERGEVAVEDLAIGDCVITANRERRLIKWIGTRAYSPRFAGNNPDLLPIRFKAGSLDENIPVRDLLVSPKHAMFLDGVLIPAEHLVNGATIVKEAATEDIRYFHIELESHDVLIAEGALSESFVDDDSRGMFQNAHQFRELYPEVKWAAAAYCAPRVEDGYALDRVRRRLAQRAGLPCPAATDFGALFGAVETGDHEGVSGWAQNAAFPDAPVCLDVMVDAAFFCYAYADGERRGGGRRFAVRFVSPLDPSRPHEIELRRSADGAVLGSGLFLAARATRHAAA